MKISTSAWHFRYMHWLGFSIPSKLCPYFWKLVFSLMIPACFAAVLGLVVFVLYEVIPWIAFHLEAISIAVAIISGVGLLAYGAIWLATPNAKATRTFIGHAPLIYQVGVGIGEGASLTGHYISAWHKKMCPLLEFTND